MLQLSYEYVKLQLANDLVKSLNLFSVCKKFYSRQARKNLLFLFVDVAEQTQNVANMISCATRSTNTVASSIAAGNSIVNTWRISGGCRA